MQPPHSGVISQLANFHQLAMGKAKLAESCVGSVAFLDELMTQCWCLRHLREGYPEMENY